MVEIARSTLPLKLVESYSAGFPKEKLSLETRSQFPTTPTERNSSVILECEHIKHLRTKMSLTRIGPLS